ncbi:MAG TPA: response regulator transcription factor [Actinophytocola sp.]|uniref:response regulator transcription factor n=1 Tax=Actinophytocola sp. TaxID=1872138 RepID=UPI002DDCCBC0|nr:response regulator transcription factor [Actinophytocola sp.]HEV2782603.1 response regulator transcription factor [Actinophytocola sp.]
MGTGTVHSAATVAQARAQALATGPCDLAILELELPDGSGIDLITELRRHGWPRIVVLTASTDPDIAQRALHAGAQAYLRKPASPPVPTNNSHPTAARDTDADRTLIPILAIATQVATPDNSPHQLTARQLQVLRLVAAGQSNKQIGHTLNLSPLTVKTHLTHIGQKLGARNRVQIVALAIRAGVIH